MLVKKISSVLHRNYLFVIEFIQDFLQFGGSCTDDSSCPGLRRILYPSRAPVELNGQTEGYGDHL